LDIAGKVAGFLGSEVGSWLPAFGQFRSGDRWWFGRDQSRHGASIFGERGRFAAIADAVHQVGEAACGFRDAEGLLLHVNIIESDYLIIKK